MRSNAMRRLSVSSRGFVGWQVLAGAGILIALMLLGIPNVHTQREENQRQLCRENLARIENAKIQYGLKNNLNSGPVTVEQLMALPERGLKLPPVCPSGGQYTIGPLGAEPSCSTPGHAIQNPPKPSQPL